MQSLNQTLEHQALNTSTFNTQTLKQRWQALLEKQPATRIREAAALLSVSEMELLASDMPDKVVQLQGDFKVLMDRLTQVGNVMSLVRNDIAVHELSGHYPALRFNRNPQVGIAMDAIDLRIHFNDYCYAFAVHDPSAKHPLRSIQFFDKSGQALQKIYLKNQIHTALWDDIVLHFKAVKQTSIFTLVDVKKWNRSFVDINIPSFKKAWELMRDIHDLSKIIKRFSISRHEAVSMIGEPFAWRVHTKAINHLMHQICEQKLSCFVFVGNKGVTQIYSGAFIKTKEMGAWANVLDPNFNLHVLTTAVKDVWVVKKPTKHGVVTSLEVYDENGKISLQFAPVDTRTKEETAEWRALFESLPKIESAKELTQ